jgi:uncharacterized protein (TIGR02285 family)
MFITILKFQIFACAFLSAFLWFPAAHAEEALASSNEISWVLLNFPPLMKLEINREGGTDITNATGPMADLQRELVKALPQYTHKYKVVTYPRAQKLFQSHGGYCTILFLENKDRGEYLYFGETIATATPPGLIIHKKNEPLLQVPSQNSLVDLGRLLKTQDFQVGIVSGRSFSPRIDEALVNTRKPVFKIVVYEAMGSLFKMLNAQRIDGVLAYYMELAEEQERNPAASDLRFYQLKEDHTSISLPVSCEKSPWGKKTLGQISVAVKDEAVKQKLSALIKQTLLIERPKHSEEPGILLR